MQVKSKSGRVFDLPSPKEEAEIRAGISAAPVRAALHPAPEPTALFVTSALPLIDPATEMPPPGVLCQIATLRYYPLH